MTSIRSLTINLAAVMMSVTVFVATVHDARADPPSAGKSDAMMQQLKFAFCQYVACANNGDGEWIDFTGSNTWISTMEHAEDGSLSVTWQLAASVINGKGLESGAIYTCRKAASERLGMSFYSGVDTLPEVATSVTWRGNICVTGGMLDFPLVFTGEIKFNFDAQAMHFTFEEIQTGCKSALTILEKP